MFASDGGGAGASDADGRSRIDSIRPLNLAVCATSHSQRGPRRHPTNFLRHLVREYGDELSRSNLEQCWRALRARRVAARRHVRPAAI